MKPQHITFDPDTETFRAPHLAEIRQQAAALGERHGTLQVEIGSNRGRFLKGLARLHPDHFHLGVEIRRKFVDLVNDELQQENIPNARCLCGDANLALPLLFDHGELHRVYVLFPDPWWKKRHAKRRLLTPEFLRLTAQFIAPGGLLILKTDVEPYAQYLQEVVQTARPFLQPLDPGDPRWPQDEPRWPHTTREVKVLRDDLPIWKFYLLRTDDPVPPQAPDEHKPQGLFPKPENHRHANGRTRLRR
jgi:tRNA (guanine-N7-)-methyltransferase